METVSLAAVEQVNQGIERREAADSAPVLILGDLVEESGGVARGQTIHKKPILAFDPFEYPGTVYFISLSFPSASRPSWASSSLGFAFRPPQ